MEKKKDMQPEYEPEEAKQGRQEFYNWRVNVISKVVL